MKYLVTMVENRGFGEHGSEKARLVRTTEVDADTHLSALAQVQARYMKKILSVIGISQSLIPAAWVTRFSETWNQCGWQVEEIQ